MNPASWLRLLCVALAVTCWPLAYAQSSGCGWLDVKVQLADGPKPCLKEFSFFNRQGVIEGEPAQSYTSMAGSKSSHAIAATANPQQCPLAQYFAWGTEAASAAPKCQDRLDKAVKELGKDSEVQSCKCEVLVDSGRSKLTRDEFSARNQLYERQVALGKRAIAVVEKAEATKKADEARQLEEIRLADRRKLEAQEQARVEAQRQSEIVQQIKPPTPPPVPQAEPVKPPMVLAQRRALVIGNDSYRHVTTLRNAREDARAMAKSFERVGYQVSLGLDLNLQEMKTALRTFKGQVEGGDEVMIFFSGHGVQLGATAYLLPVDIAGESEEQVKDDAVQLQKFLDDMTERRAKFTLAIFDACRDNPFTKVAGKSIGGRGLTATTAATGQMIIFSAGSGQKALDTVGPNDASKNGLFTRVFLKEMEAPGVSVDRVVRNVRAEVVGIAKSVGHEQVPAIYDQVIGEFYFRQKP